MKECVIYSLLLMLPKMLFEMFGITRNQKKLKTNHSSALDCYIILEWCSGKPLQQWAIGSKDAAKINIKNV